MDLNALLQIYKPPPPPEEYWFDHVYQLYGLGLPMTNPYPDKWFASRCVAKGIQLILNLLKENGEITEEAFADAKRRAVSEIM